MGSTDLNGQNLPSYVEVSFILIDLIPLHVKQIVQSYEQRFGETRQGNRGKI